MLAPYQSGYSHQYGPKLVQTLTRLFLMVITAGQKVSPNSALFILRRTAYLVSLGLLSLKEMFGTEGTCSSWRLIVAYC